MLIERQPDVRHVVVLVNFTGPADSRTGLSRHSKHSILRIVLHLAWWFQCSLRSRPPSRQRRFRASYHRCAPVNKRNTAMERARYLDLRFQHTGCSAKNRRNPKTVQSSGVSKQEDEASTKLVPAKTPNSMDLKIGETCYNKRLVMMSSAWINT